jgi:DinB family protein
MSAAVPSTIATDKCPDPNCIEVNRLADQLERAFRGGAWHGPSLDEALDGVDAAAASRRLGDAHTIAEITGHVAFWIDAARRRMHGEAVTNVPPEVDFPSGGADTDEAWQATLARLESAHRGLHAAILALDDERLDGAVAGSDPTVRGQLLGILQHNAYHAGQIAVLKKAGAGSPR